MKKYMTRWRGIDLIEEVEIVRETESSVFISVGRDKPRRASKVTSYEQYYDTWEEAHTALLDRALVRLANAKRAVDHAQADYNAILAMKP